MQDLKAASDPQFQPLIGTKIQCICKGQKWVGILQFAGINNKVHGKFQVTIDRTPLWPVDPKSIKLYDHWTNK